jgi:Uma2 family endonuclease
MSTITAPPSEAIRLDFESAGRLLTPEEFDAVADYDELYRYELIHGVLVVTPIPSEGQSDPNDELGHMLRTYRQHPQGKSLDKTIPERYIRTRESRRLADRVIWAGLGRVPDPRVDVPTIAIEFVSAGRRNWQRDYVEKRAEYAEAGVVEYWIIDRFRRTMTVYCNLPGRPGEIVVQADGVYRTPLLPGFELPLARLLTEADDWK